MRLEIPSLMGPTVAHDTRAWTIGRADPRETADYRALRREVFVAEQRVLDVDHDDLDDGDHRVDVLGPVDLQLWIFGSGREQHGHQSGQRTGDHDQHRPHERPRVDGPTCGRAVHAGHKQR